MPTIKGFIKSKAPEKPVNTDLASAMMGTTTLFNDLAKTKADIVKTVDSKIQEVESIIEDAKATVSESKQAIDDKISEFHDTAVGLIQDIKNIPQIQGLQGVPGQDADEEKIVSVVLSKIPEPQKIDEKSLIQKVITAIPKNKASLKIIQEKFETDPMSVVNKILELAKDGKFKLPKDSVDGLDQTISSMWNQVGKRGYLHGGGDTVVAGTNVTITTNANGQKVINASGGTSGLTVGTTAIASGTTTRILYDNAGVLGEYTISGSGTIVAMATAPTFGTSITGSYLNVSQILITDGSKNIVSAPTATYPSLTELSYVKGVTSAIQTQINAITAGYVSSITGTANQVIASASTGAVTLSLPQSIGTGSSPTFTGLTLSGIANTAVVYSVSGVLTGDASNFAWDSVNDALLLGAAGGVATNPTYSFAVDTDTGMFRPGANKLSLAMGGIEKVRFFSNGWMIPSDSQMGWVPGSALNVTMDTVLARAATNQMSLTSDGLTGNTADLGSSSIPVRTGYFQTSVIQGGALNLTTTSTDGIVLQNTTAATSGVTVQISPRTRWVGTAWDTAASQTIAFFAEVLPATAATPTGTLKFGYSRNGGAATYPMTIDNLGHLSVLSGIDANGSINAGSGQAVVFGSKGFIGGSATNGIFRISNDAGTAGVHWDIRTNSTFFVTTSSDTDGATVKANILQATGLTAGRVTFAGASGVLTDDADMTFSTDTLTVTKFGATTLTGTIAGGGNQINNVIIGTSTPLAGFFTKTTADQTINTANAITAVANAATVPVTSKNNIVTNNSAATLTITLTTTSAVNMQDCIVQILDFSGVAQTITWVNTENSTVSAPTTSNGSTTLPLTVGFKYNSSTSKWRCVASA